MAPGTCYTWTLGHQAPTAMAGVSLVPPAAPLVAVPGTRSSLPHTQQWGIAAPFGLPFRFPLLLYCPSALSQSHRTPARRPLSLLP